MTASIPSVDLRAVVLDTLHRIAPEVAAQELAPTRPLREQVDLDSMDWLNFLVALDKKLGVEIPEADYGKLVTLEDLVGYLARKAAGAATLAVARPSER